MEILGTKCPSITSICIQSAPAASSARTSSPSLAKSADKIDGATTSGWCIFSIILILLVFYALSQVCPYPSPKSQPLALTQNGSKWRCTNRPHGRRRQHQNPDRPTSISRHSQSAVRGCARGNNGARQHSPKRDPLVRTRDPRRPH